MLDVIVADRRHSYLKECWQDLEKNWQKLLEIGFVEDDKDHLITIIVYQRPLREEAWEQLLALGPTIEDLDKIIEKLGFGFVTDEEGVPKDELSADYEYYEFAESVKLFRSSMVFDGLKDS